ncbi:hypothetical protein E2C01_004108 [Portunus trituberculatus]|uniref:Uncharacterized protein n=1 Tax=Portunus trituberculatus TaxID=210409 RepID=A0A5B7CP12_PORTR|nr:hypothetical protein [Portunus trituberculatus]
MNMKTCYGTEGDKNVSFYLQPPKSKEDAAGNIKVVLWLSLSLTHTHTHTHTQRNKICILFLLYSTQLPSKPHGIKIRIQNLSAF